MRNLQEDIALHTIQFHADDRPKSKKRRKRWVDFVELKPSKTSVIYSKHFKADDFVRRLDVSSEEQWIPMTPWLKRDDNGINVFIGHRSAWFPLLSACRLIEFDASVICHVFIYC